MAKHGKRTILAILLALCIACSTGVLAACGDKNNGTVTYTVTVLKDADTAASGVRVGIKKGSATYDYKNTDANGKVSFALASDTYTVTLSKFPAHYELPEDADLTLTPEKTSLTVTLARKNSYTINLINPDGTPFTAQTEGLDVVVCTLTGNCLEPVSPNANGTAVKEVEKGDYHVKLDGLAAGYIYERDADGYYTGSNLSETVTELSIKIYPISAIELTAMTTEQLNAFYASGDWHKNPFAAETAGKTVYEMSVDSIPVGGYAYRSFTPQFSGKYNLWQNDDVALYCTDTFKGEPADEDMSQSTTVFVKDKTYYFAFKNVTENATSAKRAIVVPTTSYVTYNGAGGTIELTVGDATSNAIIRFAPPAAAEYKLTAQGTAPALVKTLSEDASSMEIDPTPSVSDYTVGSHTEAYYASWDLSIRRYLYFAVAVQAAQYPATVQVKLEKSREKNESDTDVEAHDLTAYNPDTTNKELVGVPMDGTANLVHNSTTDRYTYNGKEVVVMLKKNVGADRFVNSEPLAYLDKENSNIRYVKTVAKASYGFDRYDYRYFLRGFKNYERDKTQNNVIPATLDVNACYVKYANADGVYPLTEELKDFLETFYALNESHLSAYISADDASCKWMFPLYYYDTVIVPDKIVGSYTLVSYTEGDTPNNNCKANAYLLTVEKRGGFALTTYNEDTKGQKKFYTGTWEKSETVDNTYTFTAKNGGSNGNDTSVDLHFDATFDPTAKTLTLTIQSADEDYVEGPTTFVFKLQDDPIIGEYKYQNLAGTKILTVNANGTWSLSEVGLGGSLSGTWTKNGDTYTFIVAVEGDPDNFMNGVKYTVKLNGNSLTMQELDAEGKVADTKNYTRQAN